MDEPLRLLPLGDSSVVVVAASVQLNDLIAQLAALSRCLRSVPLITAATLTVGAASAGGAHGSSIRHGTLADDVVGLRLVRADGSCRWLGACCPDGDGGAGDNWARPGQGGEVFLEQTLLRAARVSGGELGAVTELALATAPLYSVRRAVSRRIERLGESCFRCRPLPGPSAAANRPPAARPPTQRCRSGRCARCTTAPST